MESPKTDYIDERTVSEVPNPPAPAHNLFLDFVRMVAIIRVLAWHTYGFAWLSYLVASMPAMFFVAGSLMARSLGHAPPQKVLVARFRRLLIPLWAFGAVAIAIMVFHARVHSEMGEPMQWSQVLWWIFPAWDPQGSEWGVTFWAVLWYLRCLTWLLLLSPLLLWLFRRISIALIALPLGLLAFFEFRLRAGHPVPWQIEDAALFSVFWLLGFAYDARLLAALTTRVRLFATLVFAAAAAGWVLTQDVPNMVVNASYPAHLFVGLAWLFAALALERPIVAFAARERPARFVTWVNDRIFTIYLWHAAGLFAMYEILWAGDRPAWLRNAAALPIVLLTTFACMLAFGWIEDFAARRELHLVPRGGPPARAAARRHWRTAVLIPAAASLGVVAMLGALLTEHFDTERALSATAVAVPPSGLGIAIRAERVQILSESPATDTPVVPEGTTALPAVPVAAADLQAVLDAWRTENGVPGATLAIRRSDGAAWAGASGNEAETGIPLDADYVFPIASVTKTFTVALILQLVEEGKVDLDQRASRYVPGIAHSGDYTVRQLIQHSSGLTATDGVAPADALLAAGRTPLAFPPGSQFLYSSPGYYMLGLVIEKVTGVSYTQALHERLLDPLKLTSTAMDEELAPLGESTHPISNATLRSSSGVLRSSSQRGTASSLFEYHGILWSSAGLQSSVSDLASWAIDLYDSPAVLSQATRDEMTTFLGSEFQYAGLGTYPFCPCWLENGKLMAERWGHYGRSGVLEYDPRDRVALSLYTSGTALDEQLIVAYDQLSGRIRELIRARPLESGTSKRP
ncbi:MAG: serine hydrolase [Acidobacteriota bacterium]